MNRSGRRWYVSLIASYYLFFCSLTCIYYVSLHFTHDATVPWDVQLLCLGGAAAAGTYLFDARLGHRLLILNTLFTLLCIGGSAHQEAAPFHVVALAILIAPFCFSRRDESFA